MKRVILAMLLLTTPTFCWAPSASAITGDEMCRAMHWPMPLPPMVGWGIGHLMSDSILICFDNVTAIASDGHDVLTETGPNESGNWRVTSMTPPAGTMVPMNQQIRMTVVRDYNAPT
jgi:hypothetical protein